MVKKQINRILSLCLTLCLVLGMVPMTAFAEGDTSSGDSGGTATTGSTTPAGIVIAAFDTLPDDVLWQGCDLGEIHSQADLTLPDALTGTDGDGTPLTIEGVTWQSNPAFDPAVSTAFPGYIFTPILPQGCIPADGVSTPVISVFIRPEGGIGIMPMAVSVNTPADLKNALEAAAADTITVTADITLTDAVTVGASHTLSINSSVTLTIGSPSSGSYTVTVPDGKTLTVTGGGELKVGNSADMGILIMGGMTVDGGKLTVANSGTDTYGICAFGQLTVRNGSDLQVKNTGNNTGIYGDVTTIKDSTAAIASTNPSMTECKGITAMNLVIDNSDVEIIYSSSTAGIVTYGGDISLINGSTVTTQGNPGTGISFNMNSGSLIIDDSVLDIQSGTGLVLSTLGGVAFTGENGGKVVLAQGAEICEVNGKMKDQGHVLTNSGWVTVGAAGATPSDGGLTAGEYVWDGSYFTKGSGTLYIAGDLTGVSLTTNQSGNGWEWDAQDATLTLYGSYPNEGIVIDCAPDDTINLVLTGNVSIQKTGYNGADRSLWVNGSLNIKAGAHTLDVSSDWSGIRVGKNFDIESGTVKATGNISSWTNGIEVSGDITISGNANVEATGDTNGLQAGGDILINTTGIVTVNGGVGGIYSDGQITATGGTVIASGGSYSGMIAENGIHITGGTVTTNPDNDKNGDVKCNLTVSGANAVVNINGNIVKGTGANDFGANLTVSDGAVTVTGTVAGTTTVTGGTVSVNGQNVPPSGVSSATGNMTIGGQNVNLASSHVYPSDGWQWLDSIATLMLYNNYTGDPISINCAPGDEIKLEYGGNITITTTGSNIAINCNGSLEIAQINGTSGTLTLNNPGTAGCALQTIYGDLKISSGTLVATGPVGINASSTGNIIISGGDVTATSNGNGPNHNTGIVVNWGYDIIITGGTVNASGKDNGQTYDGAMAADNIRISGGTVVTDSAGSGNGNLWGNVFVSGSGTVATINGSIADGGEGADLTVSDGTVTVTGTVAGAQILTGGTVSIAGVQVYPERVPEIITYPGTPLQDDPIGGSSYQTLMPVSSTSNNSVTVNSGGAAITGAVYGGFDKNGSADVTGNTVTINGGEISGNSVSAAISGGRAYNGAASGNTVTINGGTITGFNFLRGGESMLGDAKDNHIIITGGTITAQIETGAAMGTEENNRISIREGGTLDLSGSELRGYGSGSVLNIERAAVTVKQISGFKQCNFKLPASTTNGGVILTATTGANINGATIGITFTGAPSFNLNDKITLIDNASGTLANDTVTASGYTFSVSAQSGKLIATVTSVPGGGNGNTGGSSAPDSSAWSTTVTSDTDMPVTSTIEATGTVDKDGNLSVYISDPMVKEAIEKAQAEAKRLGKTADGIVVEIKVTSAGGKSMTAATGAAALSKLNTAGAGLTVTSSVSRLTLDAQAVKEAGTQSVGTVTFSAAPVTKLSDGAKALIGSRPVFDFTVSYQKDGKTRYVSSFGKGTVTLGIPYTAAAGEKAGSLFIVYVAANGKPQLLTNSSYANGWLSCSRSGLSTYGVGYKAPAPDFTDTANHWAKDSIDFVVSRGLMNGTAATTFSPGTAITRADLLMALGKLSGADVSSYKTSSFTDIKAADPAMPYIEWAVQNEIVQGIGNNQFGPAQNITREQMAVMMVNYAKAAGYTIPAASQYSAFADHAKVSTWAEAAVKAVQQAGIIVGKDGNRFDPQGSAARAEAATILRRYAELVIDEGTARGWVKNDSGQWQHYDWQGKRTTGWLSITGTDTRYYFDANGIMVTGKWLQNDGKWYYFHADGKMARNVTIEGYKVDGDGVRQEK